MNKLLGYGNEIKEVYNFTNDQQLALDGIIDFIASDFNPTNFTVGLIGAGGTGKTFITNYIIKHCKYSESVIKCTTPTHRACRVFSNSIKNKPVHTIQSTFGLRLDLKLEDFDPNNPQFNPMSTPKIENIKLLIIDESSMLPAKLVTYIYNTCKKSEIKILFIGDDCQLTPVNESISVAFKRCNKVYRLTQIVRQGENNPINEILPLLRNDINNKTNTFINFISNNIGKSKYNNKGEGYTICKKDTFKDLIEISFKSEEYLHNIDMYRIIAYTNNAVSSWNNYVRNNIINDTNNNIITKNDLIMSYETIVNEFMEIIINNSEEYIINDIVNFTDPTYNFKGFLVKFQAIYGGDITKPLFIIDHKDKYTILKYYKVLNELINTAKSSTRGLRVNKWKAYYDFKKKYLLAANIINKSGKIIYNRDLDYGFAITAHKSQGGTYDNVFVDLNDMIYDKNNNIYVNYDDLLRRVYVATSRARNQLIISYG